MLPKLNQPGKIYVMAKANRFNNINNIAASNLLKFRPVIAQTGTCAYNAVQVVAQYLKLLCSDNIYIIRNIQEFPKLLRQQEPLSPNEEYVSYDVESPSTNAPVYETIYLYYRSYAFY